MFGGRIIASSLGSITRVSLLPRESTNNFLSGRGLKGVPWVTRASPLVLKRTPDHSQVSSGKPLLPIEDRSVATPSIVGHLQIFDLMHNNSHYAWDLSGTWSAAVAGGRLDVL